jgi:hypothetical protein
MTDRGQTPDVAAILEALRMEVLARQRMAADDQHTADTHERELQRALEEIEYTRVVSAHWPLEGGNAYEQAWAFINKLVRRYLRWYINPIVEQQNATNDAFARAIRLLAESNSELRRELRELRTRLPDQGSADQASGSGVADP